jgi:hypothetical protein
MWVQKERARRDTQVVVASPLRPVLLSLIADEKIKFAHCCCGSSNTLH